MSNNDVFTVIGAIVIIALAIIFGPAICFFFGWIGGWLAKITIGGWLVSGLNALVGKAIFTKNMLPLIGGTLAWIGGFFKTVTTVKNK